MPLKLQRTLDDGGTSRSVEFRRILNLFQVLPHAYRFMSIEVVAPESFGTEKTSICSHVRDDVTFDVPLEGIDPDESLLADETSVDPG